MQERLDAEKTGAAERARKTEASSKALQEQQAHTSKALSSVRKEMEEMSSKSAAAPKIDRELQSLRKKVRGASDAPSGASHTDSILHYDYIRVAIACTSLLKGVFGTHRIVMCKNDILHMAWNARTPKL